MKIARRRWIEMAVATGATGAAAVGAHPLAAGCALPPRAGEGSVANNAGQDLLFVGTAAGLAAIPAAAGPRPGTPGAIATPTWSRLFATAHGDGEVASTQLTSFDSHTGRERSHVTVPGDLIPAVASTTGAKVALRPRSDATGSPYLPAGRERTTLVVADLAGRREPQTFHLSGNFEPEAFTADEQALVVLEYLPPLAPDRYRVLQLNLRPQPAQSQLQALLTRDKRPNLEEMRGAGRMQVFAPDCRTLYTLYTRQNDHVHARNMPELGGNGRANEHVHAFVHVLSLAEGWAFCLDLPMPFGVGPASAHAVAISPDGHRLYALDASSGHVAAADTQGLRLLRTAAVGTDPFADWSRAALQSGPQGTLYALSGTEVIGIDASTLGAKQRWPVAGVGRGLGVSADGRRVYVGLDGRVVALDAQTGKQIQGIPVAGLESVKHVGQTSV